MLPVLGAIAIATYRQRQMEQLPSRKPNKTDMRCSCKSDTTHWPMFETRCDRREACRNENEKNGGNQSRILCMDFCHRDRRTLKGAGSINLELPAAWMT